MRYRIAIALCPVLFSASTLLAQERLTQPDDGARPAPATQRRAPALERLEALRYERLQAALNLSEEQTQAVRRLATANREALRRSIEREQAAVQALERTLATEPLDEQALARSLDAVETARADMERVRRDHLEELSQVLTAEQRARYLLFNRRFDARLRELIEERRDAGAPRVRPGLRDRAPRDRRP
ncbi:MAG TPA: periplasmic heavy metal sensor [Gemmatimonadota bacterium]|nr:periplasmic heavy metal sensor [Gemmatimonadota bacterium]